MPVGKFIKGAAHAAAHPALGVFFSGPRPYGFAAAPTRPGRKVRAAHVPALHGLFRHGGPAIAVSDINRIATNIHRGQG